MPTELILLRVAPDDDTAAREYLARVATQVEIILDDRPGYAAGCSWKSHASDSGGRSGP
jgi:hypothetical protein